MKLPGQKPTENRQQAHTSYAAPYYPVQVYNGLSVPDSKGVLSQGAQIRDLRPAQFRRFVNVGYADMQLRNGLWHGVGRGIMWTPYPDGQTFTPHIPGQTRDNVGGFHKRGPSTYNVDDMLMNGPGSQPEHPGGPGQVAGLTILNPMSG